MNRCRLGFAVTACLLTSAATEAQNLLATDPDFDDAIAGWSGLAGQSSSLGEDSDGCSGSGSFLAGEDGLGAPYAVRAMAPECHAVVLGDWIYQSVAYRSPRSVYLHPIPFAGTDCTAPLISELGTEHPPSEGWTVVDSATEIVSESTHSVRFAVFSFDDESTSAFEASFDRAYLGSVPRIFADDFEGGATCRWSEVVGEP